MASYSSLLLLFLLPLFSFSPSFLRGSFVFDDLPAIVTNPDVTRPLSSHFLAHDFWGSNLTGRDSHKSYRPLTTVAFRWLYLAGDGRPGPFHAANLLLHLVNTFLVFRLSKRFLNSSQSGLKTGLLFGLHPVQCESVSGCVGLADLAYAFWTLIAIDIALRTSVGLTKKVLLVMLASFLSLLFKEQGAVMIPIILALMLIWTHKFDLTRNNNNGKHFKELALLVICLVSFLTALIYLRLWIMDFRGPIFSEQDNPAAFLPNVFARQANHHYHYALNAWLLLAPDWLCFDWAMGCVQLIKSSSDIRLATIPMLWTLVLCFIYKTVKTLHRRDGQRRATALILAAFPFIPSSNIFVTVGFVVAERSLYLTVFGFALTISMGLAKLKKRFSAAQTKLESGFALLMFFFALKCFLRSTDWRDEDSLFLSGLRVCPNNAKVHYNIAKRASDQGNKDLAISEYKVALNLHPTYEHALNNLGNIYRQGGRLLEAVALLERAVKANDRFPAAWMNLGIAQANLEEYVEAKKSYNRALELRDPYADCNFNLGNLYLKTKDHEMALDSFTKAVQQNPNHKFAWSNLILLSDDLAKFGLAEQSALKAMKLHPGVSEFPFHLANVYGKQNAFEKAEHYYQLSLSLKETSLAHGNLGVLFHRWGKYHEAQECYLKALLIEPNNKGAKNNLESVRKKIKSLSKKL